MVDEILEAAGLGQVAASQRDVDGESVIVLEVGGDGQQLWDRVRAAVPTHYPVLVHDLDFALDRDYFEFSDADAPHAPADLMVRAETIDVDARIAAVSAGRPPIDPGTGDESYDLNAYDVAPYGPPEGMVLLPRPEPWAAFAYLPSFAVAGPYEPELLVAAARRWHQRYGAEPMVVGFATGFVVPRPPADLADAERLAAEHDFFAGLTVGQTTQRAYARALLRLDHWTLFDRP